MQELQAVERAPKDPLAQYRALSKPLQTGGREGGGGGWKGLRSRCQGTLWQEVGLKGNTPEQVWQSVTSADAVTKNREDIKKPKGQNLGGHSV